MPDPRYWYVVYSWQGQGCQEPVSYQILGKLSIPGMGRVARNPQAAGSLSPPP